MNKRIIALLVAGIVLSLCVTGCAKELKVDDPTLLEFPGVKWGMTIQEVKTALNIKEGQILKDEQVVSLSSNKLYNEWELYVRDLTVFDSHVTLAMFTFIAGTEGQISEGQEYLEHTGGKYILQGVRVFLDEETDMEKLEQVMIQIYGNGVGGIYQYIECLSSGNPYRTSINANPKVRASSKIGNAFQEALSASDYREQMWICTDYETISDGMQTHLTEMLKSNGHNEDEINEWLAQTPWVTLCLSNNTFEAILVQTGEFDGAYKSYITRNSLEYRTNYAVCIAQSAEKENSASN